MIFEVDLETLNRHSHVLPNVSTDALDNFRNTRVTWFPNRLLGNYKLKHGDTITVEGLSAVYLRDNFSDQANSAAKIAYAFLRVVG